MGIAAIFLRPGIWVLAVFFCSALYMHLRGRVRHSFLRQLSDHSTFLAPLNFPIYLFSAVPRGPMQDVHRLPELKLLRDNWRIIRDEMLALLGEQRITAVEDRTDLAFYSFFKSGWKRFYLKWYDDYLPSARTRCPQTVALLQRCPSVKAALFALMEPGSELPYHRDPFAGSLRYHLGLITPNSPDCQIQVDGIPYYWRDGEDVLFDETYIHRAENHSGQTRVILFCDVERPLRTGLARAYNRFVGRYVAAATASRNEGSEHLGGLNHAFRYVYLLRLLGKRMKAANRGIYYAFKYALFGAILYWIVF